MSLRLFIKEIIIIIKGILQRFEISMDELALVEI